MGYLTLPSRNVRLIVACRAAAIEQRVQMVDHWWNTETEDVVRG